MFTKNAGINTSRKKQGKEMNKKLKEQRKRTIQIISILVLISLSSLINIRVSRDFHGESMLPTLVPKDILILKNFDGDLVENKLYVYDLYRNLSNTRLILHRYLGVNNDSCGVDWCENMTFLNFKGDNNDYIDPVLIHEGMIEYELLFVIRKPK